MLHLICIQRRKPKSDIMELQELISRGRILFSGAPKRLEVFKLVNGRRNAKEIAKKVGKPLVPTLNDLQKMKNMELLKIKQDKDGKPVKKDNSIVYEKVSLLQYTTISYFSDSTKVQKHRKAVNLRTSSRNKQIKSVVIPSENEILDICKKGEDQLYEFKGARTEVRKLVKEICAFANTKLGGLIFYGVEDDGTIAGTDKKKQALDQPLQNCIKDNISPSLVVDIFQKDILGHTILIIRVPSWNKKDVYHYDGRVYIRKGTNVFIAKPEESKKLDAGEYVV